MNQVTTYLWETHLPGGSHWSGVVRRGTTLRLTDVSGGANAAVLFYNLEEKLERYNMADTLKTQHTFCLTKGHACHSDMGRIFCCITEDTAGWHDTVCGLSDAELIQQKYGTGRYQELRNDMYRNGLDGMLVELGKWGLGRRDVVSNINFFSKVTADSSGELQFHVNHSKAGNHVDLAFEMDTLVVLSAAPHPLDPAETYDPGAVDLAVFPSPPAVTGACAHIAENARGLENTRRLYAYGGAK
ncbi:MAG TPA: urea carboxylase-associated family protein [Nitrosomonas europaea]|uniref:urea amidolyase associated protein UAAP1 n=1 Tax=Nitrosomonas europaea TaxID=915 RepID=UPI00248F666B|nr:urea amidolyase associated protein UAAP1 [Nitrosomonas europaea]HRN82042.1 urea carboxylase-associated family protein [Nitrosomonas europaea]HRO56071.1 urea carboxylase-associated family protein [Nitrosomonas europaea]HRQ08648.1 urea carboxylase-associated family protein [Nitrosomonas europaea]HUM73727.1 urea carboxylase-associated family protein [Nitrosomonas europaea]